MVEKLIWREEEGKSYLIDPANVEVKLELVSPELIIEGVNVEQIDTKKLTQEFKTFVANNDYGTRSALEEFLENKGFTFTFKHCEYVENEDMLVFHEDTNEFYNPCNGSLAKVYEYWNGSDYTTLAISDEYDNGIVETKVVISGDKISLDEWNGSDMNTGGAFEHAAVYKIFEVDGEKVEETYLLETWSRWQGDHAQGQVLNRYELEVYLESVGRNIEEYMEEIKSVS